MAATRAQRLRVIVLGNEKGGSGKSTVAMHVAIALIKANRRVASLDLDPRQRSFTHYLENRRAWARRRDRELAAPDHLSLDEVINRGDEAAATHALADTVAGLEQSHDFLIIDTPGHDNALMRQAHALADILITPLNDSFVDFDVLGTVDPETFGVTGASHYATIVAEALQKRRLAGYQATDWIVLRNRLSMLSSRNKRLVGEGLQELSQTLKFRFIDGLAERVIFREFYPRGLTAFDDLNETTLGTRPTLSHVTARQEVENLIKAMALEEAASEPAAEADRNGDVTEGDRSRDAA
jgi:chromosome partitioning protein